MMECSSFLALIEIELSRGRTAWRNHKNPLHLLYLIIMVPMRPIILSIQSSVPLGSHSSQLTVIQTTVPTDLHLAPNMHAQGIREFESVEECVGDYRRTLVGCFGFEESEIGNVWYVDNLNGLQYFYLPPRMLWVIFVQSNSLTLDCLAHGIQIRKRLKQVLSTFGFSFMSFTSRVVFFYKTAFIHLLTHSFLYCFNSFFSSFSILYNARFVMV